MLLKAKPTSCATAWQMGFNFCDRFVTIFATRLRQPLRQAQSFTHALSTGMNTSGKLAEFGQQSAVMATVATDYELRDFNFNYVVHLAESLKNALGHKASNDH